MKPACDAGPGTPSPNNSSSDRDASTSARQPLAPAWWRRPVGGDREGQVAPSRAERTPDPIRCRQIADADLDAVVALLCRGFRERTPAYWRTGLARLAMLPAPTDGPRFGYAMLAGERIVGVVLTLVSDTKAGDGRGRVCNLSSWYVEPEYRPFATLLDRVALRQADTTFTNISAAPHTLPMHEARGFVRVGTGQVVAFPLLGRRRAGVSVRTVRTADRLADLPEAERALVSDHLGYGCVALVGTEGRESQPFVFVRHPIQRFQWRFGWSPAHYLQLVHCRSTADLPRFGRALGVELLRRHRAPCIVTDADGPLPGLGGWFRAGAGVRLKRGGGLIRPGDLAYSELVLFGP